MNAAQPDYPGEEVMSSIRQDAEPVPLAEALRELVLDHVDERGRDHERIRRAWREGWLTGHGIGYGAGYEQASRDMERNWSEMARPTARQLVRGHGLQDRRWRLRGETRTRQTFGQPHPDDYRGGAA